MRRLARTTLLLTILCATLSGCAQRRIFITSEPEGAIVTLNDMEVGRTPLEVDFTFYGEYDVRLRREGYMPLITSATAATPLHEMPGIDLIAALIPGRKVTEIRWHFVLEPVDADPDQIIDRARVLRRQIGAGILPAQTETVGVPVPVAPAEGEVEEPDPRLEPTDPPPLMPPPRPR